MPEETTATPVAKTTEEQAPATTPAVAEKTETTAEHMIPKSRFDEVNEKLRKLEADAAQKAKQQQAEDERKLQEQQEWQKLAETRKSKLEELTPQVELAAKLTEMVAAQYQAEIKDWPEQVRAMAPGDDASILTKLEWMNKAKPLAVELMADKTPVPGNGRRPPPARPAGGAAKEQEARSGQSAWTRRTF